MAGRASEVEAGGLLDPLGRDGVHVALAQDDQVLAVHLDLALVLGGEEHLVADLHLAHARADGSCLAPDQPLGDLCGGRDEDAAGRPPVAVLLAQGHQDAVVQHLDRELPWGVRHAGHATPPPPGGLACTKPPHAQPSSCSRASSIPKWCAISCTTVTVTSSTTSSTVSQ